MTVPYVALRPGSVRPVSDQINVEGAKSFPPEQGVAFTTVNVGSVTLLEALAGWLDDDVDVLPEDRVRGDRSAAERSPRTRSSGSTSMSSSSQPARASSKVTEPTFTVVKATP